MGGLVEASTLHQRTASLLDMVSGSDSPSEHWGDHSHSPFIGYPNNIGGTSAHSVSVGCTSNSIGIMFLNEVVLGKEHHITRDDWTLIAPPVGYDSIVAKGRTEPGIYTICV